VSGGQKGFAEGERHVAGAEDSDTGFSCHV
jgi:hypothetical protein